MKKAFILTAILFIFAASVAVFTACGSSEEATKYTIKAVYDAENRLLDADMTVHYVNDGDALDSVYFHLYPASYREGARFAPITEDDVGAAYPNGISYGGITIENATVGGENVPWEIGGEDENMLIVNTAVDGGKSADIGISFTVNVPEVRHRLGYADGVLNLGNWYPIAAVYENGAFRCDPYYSNGDPFYSETADYDVELTLPSGWEAAGSGSVTTTLSGDVSVFEFTAENVRDFAICASAGFTCVEGEQDGVKIRFYGNPLQAENGLEIAKDAVRTFSELFGQYPYATYSVAVTPFTEGGMEYPALAYISSDMTGSLFAETIVHETAHQWWYAAVGNDQINNAWMDEGLAEYSTTLFYEHNPSYGVTAEDRIADAMQSFVLFSEVYGGSEGFGRMDRALGEYSTATEYAFHAYVKGELMFDSVRHVIGDDAFLKALRAYYKEYSGKTATPDALIAAFEEASGLQLADFMESWISGEAAVN